VTSSSPWDEEKRRGGERRQNPDRSARLKKKKRKREGETMVSAYSQKGGEKGSVPSIPATARGKKKDSPSIHITVITSHDAGQKKKKRGRI